MNYPLFGNELKGSDLVVYSCYSKTHMRIVENRLYNLKIRLSLSLVNIG